jgi:hypothetical protein
MVDVVIERAEVLVHVAGVTCVEAAVLCNTARAIRSDSLMVKVRAQEVRGVRSVCGGSVPDHRTLAALVVSVILERPTCLLCIAPKVGADDWAVLQTLERISETIEVTTEHTEPCRACGTLVHPVYSLPRR